jgi:hypothetical protein
MTCNDLRDRCRCSARTETAAAMYWGAACRAAGRSSRCHSCLDSSTRKGFRGFEIVRRRESVSGVAIQLARKAVLSDSTRDLQLHVRACRPRSFSLDARVARHRHQLRSARPIQRDRSSEKRPRRAHERLPIFFFPSHAEGPRRARSWRACWESAHASDRPLTRLA